VLELKIVANRVATPTSRIVRLALDAAPFSYEAGQATWLAAVPDGDFTPYSFASWPEETVRSRMIEFLVKVDGSTRFGARVGSLRRGDHVVVRGPVGSFVLPPEPAESGTLFIAGGTGIAPLRSMIHHAVESGWTKLKLLYSARSAREFAYLTDMRALNRQGRLDLALTVTGDAPRWTHGRGRIDVELLRSLIEGPQMLAFICGPPTMLTEVSQALLRLGLAPDCIRTETW
jgi:phenol hydroxylase P5 protein